MATRTHTRTKLLMRWPVSNLPVEFRERRGFDLSSQYERVHCSDNRDHWLSELVEIARYQSISPELAITMCDNFFQRAYQRVINQGIGMRRRLENRGNPSAGIVALVDSVPFSIEQQGTLFTITPGYTRLNIDARLYIPRR
ncbi:MAG TPA: hypothetical protein VJK52_04365 [Candidatus Nanoarchaeia archaeon]|nr:hypothetical protein [Candidatus Nanoarchaeia archaeon]